MVLVPADRMMALLPQRPISENIAAPLYNRVTRWGPINVRHERARVQEAIDKLQIDTRAASQARRLSGGNRQKLTIARWLAAGFQVMLCFDPTRGIDVGTKRQIYVLLRELADAGAAILLFTTELPEIQLVCDRVVVLYQGGVSERLPGGGGRARPGCCAPRTAWSRRGRVVSTTAIPARRRTGRRIVVRHGWTIGVASCSRSC